MTDNEMRVLVLLLKDVEEWEKQRAGECERESAALPSSDLRNKICFWERKHKECIEAAKLLSEVFDYYILNKIHNIIK